MKGRIFTSLVLWMGACHDGGAGDEGNASTSTSSTEAATKADSNHPGAQHESDGAGTTGSGSSGMSRSTDGDDSSGALDSTAGESIGNIDDDTAPLFVHATAGFDSNPGTAEQPLRTIQHALTVASSKGREEVRIAAGHYSAVYADDAAITLRGGISLRGGFSSTNWDDHNPVEYETRVTGGQPYVILVEGGGTEDTIIEGLAVWMTDVSSGAAVVVDGGSPTLVSNWIRALRTNTQDDSAATGIDVRGGSARIARNWIIASTLGVRLDDAHGVLLDSNMILASGASSGDRVVAVESNGDGEVRLEGNALWTDGPWSAAYLGDLYEDHLIGNVLRSPHCVLRMTEEIINVPDSSEIAFNAFHCGALYTHYAGPRDSGPDVYTTLSQLHGFVPMTHDNIVRNLVLGVGDGDGYPGGLYVLRSVVNGVEMEVDCGVARAGWGDEPGRVGFDGEPRTAPWSIGATEIDGPCL